VSAAQQDRYLINCARLFVTDATHYLQWVKSPGRIADWLTELDQLEQSMAAELARMDAA
jgi:hypothetical protein